MSKAKFTAELFEGHKDVHAVIVPFDPQEVWGQKPVKIDPRRDGWLIRGTMNRVRFLGWIGYRWGRFFIIVEPEMRETLGVSVGANIVFVIEPTNSEAAMKIAREQAKLTTASSKRKRRRAYREQKGRDGRVVDGARLESDSGDARSRLQPERSSSSQSRTLLAIRSE